MEKLDFGVPRNLEFKYGDKAKLDEADKKILRLLSSQGRLSIAEISNRLKISRDVVKYRIEKLISNEVIQGFVAVANPTKLGLPNMVLVSIAIHPINAQREKQLINYVRAAPYVVYAAKTIGKWGLHIEVYSKHNKHLDEILNELREKFSDIITDMEITSVIEEYKWTEFPGIF